MEGVKSQHVDWCAAKHALPGQRHSGDKCLVKGVPAGALLAVVDGLGHGSEAAAAAGIAIGVLRRSAGEHLLDLVSECHEALRDSRGVVMSLAWYNAHEETLSWVGVGNVMGLVIRSPSSRGKYPLRLVTRAGVVGAHLPSLHVATVPVQAGDTLVLVTDGIAGDFDRELDGLVPVRTLADGILARHGRTTDDALVLVARFVRAGP